MKYDSSLGQKGNARIRAMTQNMMDQLFEKNSRLKQLNNFNSTAELMEIDLKKKLDHNMYKKFKKF